MREIRNGSIFKFKEKLFEEVIKEGMGKIKTEKADFLIWHGTHS